MMLRGLPLCCYDVMGVAKVLLCKYKVVPTSFRLLICICYYVLGVAIVLL